MDKLSSPTCLLVLIEEGMGKRVMKLELNFQAYIETGIFPCFGAIFLLIIKTMKKNSTNRSLLIYEYFFAK